jgi:8-oxo-dGTP diphosphatase
MKSKGGYPFNVRVYGILINGGNVLVTDERIAGKDMTKFPGGGLEFGEGTLEGLIREFKEELNITISVESHFYTTDFFVQSAFNQSQVISIYYLVNTKDMLNIHFSDKVFDFEQNSRENQQVFRWISLSEISGKHFTFAADKRVGELLQLT